jgi:hypothetical protein
MMGSDLNLNILKFMFTLIELATEDLSLTASILFLPRDHDLDLSLILPYFLFHFHILNFDV